MKARRIRLWLPADIVEWLQAHPGDESEAAERILRREMEGEKALLSHQENVDGLVGLLEQAPAV